MTVKCGFFKRISWFLGVMIEVFWWSQHLSNGHQWHQSCTPRLFSVLTSIVCGFTRLSDASPLPPRVGKNGNSEFETTTKQVSPAQKFQKQVLSATKASRFQIHSPKQHCGLRWPWTRTSKRSFETIRNDSYFDDESDRQKKKIIRCVKTQE